MHLRDANRVSFAGLTVWAPPLCHRADEDAAVAFKDPFLGLK